MHGLVFFLFSNTVDTAEETCKSNLLGRPFLKKLNVTKEKRFLNIPCAFPHTRRQNNSKVFLSGTH